MLTLAEYEQGARTTARYPAAGTGSNLALAYLIMGLNGEAGEIADKLKKHWRDEGGPLHVPSVEKSDAMLMELGDVLWYVSQLCGELGSSLEEVAEANLAKLASRRERDMIRGSGDDR